MSLTLTKISGVGPETAKLLMEHGLKSPAEIGGASIERLCTVPGIGPVRAGVLVKAANALLTGSNEVTKTATKSVARPRRTPKKPKPSSTTGNKSTKVSKPKGVTEMSKKEQEKLKKAKKAAEKKAARKAAKKAEKKAAAKKALKKAAKKAAEKKAAKKKAEKKAEKKAAKKAEKKAEKKAKAKKLKAKAKKADAKKPKAKKPKAKAKKAKAKKSKK